MPRKPGYKWSDESKAKLSKSRKGINPWSKDKIAGISPYDRYLRLTYNVTEEKYNQMVVDQGGVCKICGKPERAKINGKVKRLVLDHCHQTGKIRGLLCTLCNYRVGVYECFGNDCREYLDRYR
jgi:hypothetical protein